MSDNHQCEECRRLRADYGILAADYGQLSEDCDRLRAEVARPHAEREVECPELEVHGDPVTLRKVKIPEVTHGQ